MTVTDASIYQPVFDALDRAATDPGHWTTVCDRVSELVDATGAVLIPGSRAARMGFMPSTETLLRANEDYIKNEVFQRDLREVGIPRMFRTGFMTDFDALPPEMHARHPYYQEFLSPHGLRWFVGMGFRSDGGSNFGVVSIQGSIQRGPFLERDIARLEKVRPALQLAVRQAELFGWQRIDSTRNMLEPAGMHLLALDWAGKVTPLGESAAAVARAAGLRLEGTLSHISPRASVALQRSSDAVLAYPRSDLRAVPGQLQIRDPDGRTFSIELIPTPRDFPSFVANIAGLVIIREIGKRRSYLRDKLRREFGLSSSEIKLIEKIAAGHNVREAAEMLMISYETARTYLKSIFSKTDTHSQQELFRFVLTMRNGEFEG